MRVPHVCLEALTITLLLTLTPHMSFTITRAAIVTLIIVLCVLTIIPSSLRRVLAVVRVESAGGGTVHSQRGWCL